MPDVLAHQARVAAVAHLLQRLHDVVVDDGERQADTHAAPRAHIQRRACEPRQHLIHAAIIALFQLTQHAPRRGRRVRLRWPIRRRGQRVSALQHPRRGVVDAVARILDPVRWARHPNQACARDGRVRRRAHARIQVHRRCCVIALRHILRRVIGHHQVCGEAVRVQLQHCARDPVVQRALDVHCFVGPIDTEGICEGMRQAAPHQLHGVRCQLAVQLVVGHLAAGRRGHRLRRARNHAHQRAAGRDDEAARDLHFIEMQSAHILGRVGGVKA